MFGTLGSLKAGQQGGGFAAVRKSSRTAGKTSHFGPSPRPSPVQTASAAARVQTSANRQQKPAVRLPDWIYTGQRLGYLSRSSGKLCEVLVDSIIDAKREVKIVFAEDRTTWKSIPFSWITSRDNPLRRLAATGGSNSLNEMLHAAQASKIDKDFLFDRVVGSSAALMRAPLAAQPLVGSTTKKVVEDSAIAASSFCMNSPQHGLGEMWRSRIDNTESSWRASIDTLDESITWDFGGAKQITKILTKGCNVGKYWLTEFKLSYTMDGSVWSDLSTVFSANSDPDTLVENSIEPPVEATKIRLHPTGWHEHIGMRAELMGFSAGVAEDRDNASADSVATNHQSASVSNRSDPGSAHSPPGSERSRSPRRVSAQANGITDEVQVLDD